MDVLWASVDRISSIKPNLSCGSGHHYDRIILEGSKDGGVYLDPIFALGFFCSSLKFSDLANEPIIDWSNVS